MSPCRASLVLASLATFSLACRMDNPAFEGGDELAEAGSSESDESGSGSSSGMSESASEVGESVSGSESASTESTTDETGGCTPGDACGECHECDALGECVPKAGALCGEVDCAEFVAGPDFDACFAYAPAIVPKKCDEQGACVPMLGECVEFGMPLCQLACALECVPWVHVRENGCVLDGETPACGGAICGGVETLIESSCVGGMCLGFESICQDGTACADGECVPLP